jgi:hypothetical protein
VQFVDIDAAVWPVIIVSFSAFRKSIRTKQELQERRLGACGSRWQPVHRFGSVKGILMMLNVRCRSEARMLNASVIGLRN